MTKMNELLGNQSIAITNMNNKIERLVDDVQDLRTSPNYDDIYNYIDRQVL